MAGLCVCRPFLLDYSALWSILVPASYNTEPRSNPHLAQLESRSAMGVCDFSNSYMTWVVEPNLQDQRKPGHMQYRNSARIQLDARCEIVDEKVGASEVFFLITPCRSEWMYRSDTLFQYPNGEYCAIWSESEFINVGHGLTDNGGKQTAALIKDRFKDFRLTIRTLPRSRSLVNSEQIIQATRDNYLLIGRTDIWDRTRKMRARIEYPIKTINTNDEHKLFQVDTGRSRSPTLLVLPYDQSNGFLWLTCATIPSI